jgi:hypothetical protein
MAAASDRVSNMKLDPKMVAAELLMDNRLTAMIYPLIRAAAGNGYKSNEVCAYPIEELATKRTLQCIPSSRYIIEYNPNDLTIVGGMAFSLYDHAIRDIKIARSLKPLKEYLTKNTSDIDMVWWPRIFDSEPQKSQEIITVSSPAIDKHVENFKEVIIGIFQNPQYIDLILELIKQSIPDIKSLTIDVKRNVTIQAGVNHIIIYFNITYQNDTIIQLEICDISIHDGGSSQLTIGQQGRPILIPMEKDPMYVSQLQIKSLSITRNIFINVPIMLKLIDQQLLAFSNLLERKLDKCLVNYNRIRYILFLLLPRNSARMALLEMFNIDSPNYVITNTEMALTQIIQMRCGNDNRKLCVLLQQLQRQKQADTMTELQLQFMKNEQNEAKKRQQLSSPKKISPHKPLPMSSLRSPSSAQRSLAFAENASGNMCTLPDKIEYVIGKSKIQFELNNPEKKQILERSNYCKYYHILDKITHNNISKTLKGTDKEQFKRIKKDMHDYMAGVKDIEYIKSKIEEEKTRNTLKDMLEHVKLLKQSPSQGGRYKKRRTQRKRKMRRSMKRH